MSCIYCAGETSYLLDLHSHEEIRLQRIVNCAKKTTHDLFHTKAPDSLFPKEITKICRVAEEKFGPLVLSSALTNSLRKFLRSPQDIKDAEKALHRACYNAIFDVDRVLEQLCDSKNLDPGRLLGGDSVSCLAHTMTACYLTPVQQRLLLDSSQNATDIFLGLFQDHHSFKNPSTTLCVASRADSPRERR